MNQKIDAFDRKILAILQEEARATHAEIGRRIHLSAPAVAERIRRMEAAGLIRGYRVELDAAALGYGISALIRLSTQQGRPYAQFVAHHPQIIDCFTVTGEDGAIMRVLARDIVHLQEIIHDLNAFGSTSTAIVLTTHVLAKPLDLGFATRTAHGENLG